MPGSELLRTRSGLGQSDVRDYNRSLLLDLVRRHGPIARRDLMRLSGLSRAAVFSLADELREDGWFVETSAPEGGTGRTPMLLELAQNAGRVVGVELGITSSTVAMFDLAGEIQSLIEFRHVSNEPDAMIRQLGEVVSGVVAGNDSVHEVFGVGVAVSGLLDHEVGSVTFSPNLEWHSVPLRDKLEAATNLPVLLENHAKAGALGEAWFGKLDRPDNLIFVYVDVGVGAGTLINGRLHWADRRGAPGFGHTVIQIDGIDCPCGNRGCLERYASTRAATQLYADRAFLHEPPTWEFFLSQLDGGDEAAKEVIHEVGQYLGVGVTNLLNLFAPDYVVIGGHLGAAEVPLVAAVRDVVRARTYAQNSKVQIVPSSYGNAVCAAGAAAHVLEQVFGIL